jgi:type II secretory pathway component PulM
MIPNILEKLKPREKKILYVVMGLLVFMLGYHGVWFPLTDKISSLDDEIFSMEMRLRKAKILVRQRDEVLEEAKKYTNLDQLNAGTDEEETARLLSLIEQTARKTGCSLSDVKPEAVRTDKWIKRFLVELTAESSLEQLTTFIYELEHSPQKEDKSTVLRSRMTVVRTVTT